MKILIVEDDRTGSVLLKRILSPYGTCEIRTDGVEAVEAFSAAWASGEPFDLICMDIMMPNMDGKEALTRIRELERQQGVTEEDRVKVVMISALDDSQTIMDSFFKAGATSYLVKPITKRKVLEVVGWNQPESDSEPDSD